ncbi:MAG: hypothetical protein QOC97_268 [Chloroflexota bacterium]|nr:hypothetical protein [Chloroflexota bacterium]
MGGSPGDLGIDPIAVGHLGRHELTGQGGGVLVAFLLGQVALEDGIRGALPEIRLEDRRESEPATGPPASDAISPRRHRPAR